MTEHAASFESPEMPDLDEPVSARGNVRWAS
jgi:hypothetical protein